jgi:hypothetical protein
MTTNRKVVRRLAGALAAVSVTVAGTAASDAAPAVPAAPASTLLGSPDTSAYPDPDAPHVGHVKGVRYGSDLQIDNPASLHAFRVLHRHLIADGTAAGAHGIDRVHPSKGTSFDATTLGSQATQSVSLRIRPALDSTTLYTPTMNPSGGRSDGSCVEMSTAYFHTAQVVAAWDWCVAISFVAEVDIDKSFMKTYTRKHSYSTQIVQTNASRNTWTSFLYNYRKGTWELFFRQHGSSWLPDDYQGWNVYEVWSELDDQGQSNACSDLEGKRIEARNILVGVDGKLVPANDSNAGQSYDTDDVFFYCDSFSYKMIRPLSHWRSIG